MIDQSKIRELVENRGVPIYIYSREEMQRRAELLLGLELPHGLIPRYAVKANPYPSIIRLFDEVGLWFHASSSFEAEMLIQLGIDGRKISLSSQQPAHNLPGLLAEGVQYVATSLHQLELFLSMAIPGQRVGLRVNPGAVEGYEVGTLAGGVDSSFGLWHEYLPQALERASDRGIVIDRLHIHAGSGNSPAVWEKMIRQAITVVTMLPDVTSVNIGGGFKVRRLDDEQEADMTAFAQVCGAALNEFGLKTGRGLQLEIEPGTWLVANAGMLISTVTDIVDTGANGHTFLRVDTGMNDFLRPMLYGARHHMEILNQATEKASYVVTGHTSETGDLLTPSDEPRKPASIELNKAAIGDLIAIYDTGAYCASMAAHGYNAFPKAVEALA